MTEAEKGIGQRVSDALEKHRRRGPMDHPAGSVKATHFGRALELPVYTDATRPDASKVGAGAVIYNSTDNGLNVSDGSAWRTPSGGWVVT